MALRLEPSDTFYQQDQAYAVAVLSMALFFTLGAIAFFIANHKDTQDRKTMN